MQLFEKLLPVETFVLAEMLEHVSSVFAMMCPNLRSEVLLCPYFVSLQASLLRKLTRGGYPYQHIEKLHHSWVMESSETFEDDEVDCSRKIIRAQS